MLTHVTRQRARGTHTHTTTKKNIIIYREAIKMPSMLFSSTAAAAAVPPHSTLSLTYTSQITLRFPYILHSKNRRALCRQYVYRVVCAFVCRALCAALFLWMAMSTLAIHLAMELKQIHKSQSIEAKQIVNHRPASTTSDSKKSTKNEKPTTTIQITLVCTVRTKRNGDMQARTIHTHTHAYAMR